LRLTTYSGLQAVKVVFFDIPKGGAETHQVRSEHFTGRSHGL
jgi:hypothetical protein